MAVPGVHPAIPEVRARGEQLLVADLLECNGWACVGEQYAVAVVIDRTAQQLAALPPDQQVRGWLDAFCADCLPMGAGWWARSKRWVTVLWPADSPRFTGTEAVVAVDAAAGGVS